MKNKIKIIFTFCTLLLVSACVDDDKLFELEDFQAGALPNIVKTTNDTGFINLLDLPSTTIEFTVDFSNNLAQSADGGITNGGSGKETTSTEYSPVSTVELQVTYSNAVTGTVEVGSVMTIASWPATVTLSPSDLVAAFPSLTSTADLNLGDQFVFVNGITFADGRVFPAFVKDVSGAPLPNYSVNFNGEGNNPGFNYSVAYNVSCPSSIPLGDWTNVTTAADNCVAVAYKSGGGVVQLTSIGPGRYELSNFDFGFYGLVTRGQFNDVCNNLALGGATEAGINWAGAGVYTPNGGVNGLGRLEFPCHQDLTYNPGYLETLIYDKN